MCGFRSPVSVLRSPIKIMIRNYIKIALRSLLQNKVYALVSLFSLILGLTVVMLISLYVKDDYSFDKFHTNGNQIFRLVQDFKDQEGKINKMGNTGIPQGPAFKAELPEIIDFCRFKNGWNTLVQKDKDGFKENLIYADPSVLTMFSFDILAGKAQTALRDLNSVVITKKTAEKYFKGENPLGKILNIGDEGAYFKPFVVTAVVESAPINSSIQFDLLLSFQHIIPTDPAQKIQQENWFNASLNTFLLLHPKTKIAQLEKKMIPITAKYIGESNNQSNQKSLKFSTTFKLQSFFQMHLDPDYYATNGLEYWSNEKYPIILSGLALLILIIACINYINLTLARSLKRSKEIGIRKTTGSTKTQLVLQFLSESFLLTLFATLPSILLTYLLLPSFSEVTEKHLDGTMLFEPNTILILIALILLVTFLAGLYPAIVLSNMQPMSSLKGGLKFDNRNTFGKALVVFQFVLAGIMIIGTIVFYQQFQYISEAKLGYKTDNILRFWIPWEQVEKIAKPMKNELSNLPMVKNVSAKSGDWNSTSYEVNNQKTDWVYYEHIDENHLQLMGIPLISGRYLSSKYSFDTISNIVVNESFVNNYIPRNQDPYETIVKQGNENIRIVGVVKDFHYNSFKEKIKPIVWILDKGSQAGCLHIEIENGRETEALASIKKVYKKFVPYLPMEYKFLEDFRMNEYADDLRWQKLLNYSAIIGILIACLGLFGMATFNTENRTKEIGIRKVLGASIISIATLLSKDFLKLVLIAIIIASPIAYYFMDKWLADFAYRVNIEWWVFALAGVLAILIALLTVGYQSVKAALMNPVKSLKTE
jgi:putative ABC transport system permease protein